MPMRVFTKQAADRHIEERRDLVGHIERGVFRPSLVIGHEGELDPELVGKLVLGEAACLAKLGETTPEERCFTRWRSTSHSPFRIGATAWCWLQLA